jgi:hypothetical protein
MSLSPSRLSARLRSVADRIDRSRLPSRSAVAAELRRVLAAVGDNKAYRVTTDEPQGLCVGFRPSDELLEQLGAEVDEWDVGEDDGSDGATPYVDGATGSLIIVDLDVDRWAADPALMERMSPLGQDLSVWRDEQEVVDELGEG